MCARVIRQVLALGALLDAHQDIDDEEAGATPF